METIHNIPYYTLQEIAVISQEPVHLRTLRHWIQNGDLDHFLYGYKKTITSPIQYRLQPPHPSDILWDDGSRCYHIPEHAPETEDMLHGE